MDPKLVGISDDSPAGKRKRLLIAIAAGLAVLVIADLGVQFLYK